MGGGQFPGFDPQNFKKLRNQKLRSWIIRQLFTGFFVWLLRDKSWIDVVIVIWIITASLSLSTILFLNKLINNKINKFQKSHTEKDNHQSDDDFVDVEVIED
jgi:hypothetical protein